MSFLTIFVCAVSLMIVLECGQGAQKSLHDITGKVQQMLMHTDIVSSTNRQCKGASQPAESDAVKQSLDNQLEAWRRNGCWTDRPPHTEVSVPKGTLCLLKSTFELGIPPDVVFNIIIDPENKRVFKNIKEVTHRKVIEDEGHRQLVEVEQAAIWRFLCFSGTISVRVFVDQDRNSKRVKYHLSRKGFMKRFEGFWEIRPLYVDLPHCALIPSPENDPECSSGKIASQVHLVQRVQPMLIPPPPLSWYVRGITVRVTELLIEDLQAEAKRLREGEAGQRSLDADQQFDSAPTKMKQNKSLLERKLEQGQRFRHLSNRNKRRTAWRIKGTCPSLVRSDSS